MPARKKAFREGDVTHSESQQQSIDSYRKRHFESIRNLEAVIEVCKKASVQIKDPEELKAVQYLLRGTKKDLWRLKNKTPDVLKNAEAMQKNLDSMT
jgi:hypothetical protein